MSSFRGLRVLLPATLAAAVTSAAVVSPPATRPAPGASSRAIESVVASRPGGAVEDDWPMFRGNPRLTGIAPRGWKGTPAPRWRYSAGDAVCSSPAIVGDRVYFGCDDGVFYALRLRDGSELWKFRVGAEIRSSPGVFGGTVFFGDAQGVFHALSEHEGKQRWSFKTGGEIVSSANVVGDAVVFGSYDGKLYCLDREAGGLRWGYETADRIHGTPSVTQGGLAVAGCDGFLHVVSEADGRKLATVDLGGVSGTAAASDGARIALGTFNNEVVLADWEAGRILWRYENPERQFPFYSSAVLTGKTVFAAGRDKCVYALDAASGAVRWTVRLRGRVDASAVLAGDWLFVASLEGELLALDAADGREKWRFEAGGPVSASPAVGRGCLVVGTEDGMVYCFEDG